MEKENRHIISNEPDEAVLLRYISETASEEEKIWVDGWLRDDEAGENILLQLATIDHALRTKKRIASRNSLEAFCKVERRIKRLQRKNWINRTYLAAACFLGILILSTTISYWRQKGTGDEAQIVTVQANAGMRTHFNLPDGTVAYLNSGSVLSYPLHYDKKERRVTLTGEAYFKVTHNPEQPFIVSVANDRMRVKVLGTEFNLMAYHQNPEEHVTLVRGKVKVRDCERRGEVVLTPGVQAVFDKDREIMTSQKVDVGYYTAWMEDLFAFRETPFDEVMRILARWYDFEFFFQNPDVQDFIYSGKVERYATLNEVLDVFRQTGDLDFDVKDKVVIVRRVSSL